MSQTVKLATTAAYLRLTDYRTFCLLKFPRFIQYETGYSYPQMQHNVRIVLSWSNLSEQIPAISLAAVKQQGYLVDETGNPRSSPRRL